MVLIYIVKGKLHEGDTDNHFCLNVHICMRRRGDFCGWPTYLEAQSIHNRLPILRYIRQL